MADPIRILIVDDHPVVRGGLKALFSTESDLEVVGEAGDGEEAIDKAASIGPDVILMDLLMPRKSGIEATAEIKAANPNARILVLTSFADDDDVFPAIKSGALGYLLKDSSPNELIRAIHAVHEGESFLHPTIARKLVNELSQPASLPPTEDPLTQREVEVLALVAQGMSNQEIADEIHVSERTIGKHISNILEKLHLANRTQAALYALREGLAEL